MLVLVLDDHAVHEAVVEQARVVGARRAVVENGERAPPNFLEVRPRVRRREERQGRAVAARVPERVVEIVEVWGDTVVTQRPHEPEVLVVADVGQVPREGGHQRRVLRGEELVVERGQQPESASTALVELVVDHRHRLGAVEHRAVRSVDSKVAVAANVCKRSRQVCHRFRTSFLRSAAQPIAAVRARMAAREIPPERMSALDPVDQPRAVEDGQALVGPETDEHHARVEGVGRPRFTRIGSGDGRRPSAIDARPDVTAVRARSRVLLTEQVGHEVRGSPRVGHVAVDVDVDLDRRGVAHHRATGPARRVEVRLHRAIAGGVEDALWHALAIEACRDHLDAVVVECHAQRGRVRLGRVDRIADTVERSSADLELTTRFDGQAAVTGEAAVEPGDHRLELCQGDPPRAIGGGIREPFQFEPDAR